MPLTGFDLVLWIAGFGAHLVLLYVLAVRIGLRQFPLFSSLIVANLLRSVVLSVVRLYATKSGYFYTFWSFGVIDTGLELGVVYEMYRMTFRPLGFWAKDVRSKFLGLVLLAVLVASMLTWLAAPHAELEIQAVVIRGNFFSSICLCELFVGMTALAVESGLPWKTHVARISQGLGVYSAVDVLIEVGHAYWGLGSGPHYTTLSHVRMLVYLGCVFYWIVTLSRPAPQAKSPAGHLLRQLLELQNGLDSDLEGLRARKT